MLATGEYVFRKKVNSRLIAVNSNSEIRVRLYTSNEKEAMIRLSFLKEVVEDVLCFVKTSRKRKIHINNVSLGSYAVVLIASFRIFDSEVTIKSIGGNEANFAKIINKLVTFDVKPNREELSVRSIEQTPVLDAWKIYCEGKDKPLTPKTIETRHSYSFYMRMLFEHLKFSDITYEKACVIKDLIPQLPFVHKNRQWYEDGGSFVNVKPDMVLVTKNRVSYIQKMVVAFFNWAMGETYIRQNHFATFNMPVVKHKKIRAYDIKELTTLLTGENFARFNRCHDYRYWAPLISLYSGALVMEVLQLEIKDIKINKEGRYFIHICRDKNTSWHVKTVKNDHSDRWVPLHSELIRLGFDRYYKTLVKEGFKLLFPGIQMTDEGATQVRNMTGPFSQYKTALLGPDRSKNFHSFRHTFVSPLQHKNAPLHLVQQVVGHKNGNITFDVYGEPVNYEELVEVIESVSYDLDIDPWEDTPLRAHKRRHHIGRWDV